MPINYKEYPPDWEERRQRILERAGHCCEFCSIANYTKKPDGTLVILTIAHLDHDVENWQVADERLAALCQKHHLGYDRWRHTENFKYGRNFRRYQEMLFAPDACRRRLSIAELRSLVFDRERHGQQLRYQRRDYPAPLLLFQLSNFTTKR